MANLRASITTGGEVALSAATAKTVLQLVAPTNQRLLLKSLQIAFDGVTSSAEPVVVELVKQSTAGTSTAVTPVRDGDPGSETLQATANKNCTVEPTTTDVLRQWEFHPQGGGIDRSFGYGEEIPVPGGTRLGIRCTAPATVNCAAGMQYEE